MKIDIRNVVQITDDRIVCRDHQNSIFIELSACAERFKQKYPNINGDTAKYRCIGERFYNGTRAYYKLYSDEPYELFLNLRTNAVKRFLSKLFGRNFHKKDYQLFMSVQKELNAHGWTTYDLS